MIPVRHQAAHLALDAEIFRGSRSGDSRSHDFLVKTFQWHTHAVRAYLEARIYGLALCKHHTQ